MQTSFATAHRSFERLALAPEARESRAGTAWAIGKALLLHAVVLTLLIAGLWGKNVAPTSGARGTINVDLIAHSSLSAAMQHTLSPPSPEPQPQPQPAAPPEPALPEPAAQVEPVEPAAVSDAPRAPSTAEAVIPQPQTAGGDPGSTGAGDEFKADVADQTFSDRRLRVLAIRRENRARQTFAATKSAGALNPRARTGAVADDSPWIKPQYDAEAVPAASITVDPQTWPDATSEDQKPGLRARFQQAIQTAILTHWSVPDALPLDQPCRVVIERLPQGGLLQVRVDETCPLDEPDRAAIRLAVQTAQPLPYEGFEVLQSQTLLLDFRRHAPGHAPADE